MKILFSENIISIEILLGKNLFQSDGKISIKKNSD